MESLAAMRTSMTMIVMLDINMSLKTYFMQKWFVTFLPGRNTVCLQIVRDSMLKYFQCYDLIVKIMRFLRFPSLASWLATLEVT